VPHAVALAGDMPVEAILPTPSNNQNGLAYRVMQGIREEAVLAALGKVGRHSPTSPLPGFRNEFDVFLGIDLNTGEVWNLSNHRRQHALQENLYVTVIIDTDAGTVSLTPDDTKRIFQLRKDSESPEHIGVSPRLI